MTWVLRIIATFNGYIFAFGLLKMYLWRGNIDEGGISNTASS